MPPTKSTQDRQRRQAASTRGAGALSPQVGLAWQSLTIWAGVALVAMVVIAYLPALDAEFIWDDETNVTNNETLRSLDGLRQMWFVPRSIQQYYPLMYTTYWVEYHLWGLAPFGYHLVNILLHATAALLVWRLLLRLQVPGAWLAAAIFAVHPVEVESVAWVTERKNVLSLSLALLAMLAYVRFDPPEASTAPSPGPGRWRWYATAVVLFALALFAKTVVVTLPAVMLVIYWWKRGRVTARDVAYMAPLFGLSIAMGLVTRWVELNHVGAEGNEWSMGEVERLLLAGRALWFYVAKLAWPHPLVLFYPNFTIDSGQWWQYLFPLAAILLPVGLWLARNSIGRGPLAAVLIFCGVMVPALGFFNVYFMQYAQVSDHFQYHASIALIALVAASAVTLSSGLKPQQRVMARVGASLVLFALAVLTYCQTFIYHDLEVLYRDTIAKNPQSWIAYLNLSTHLDSLGRADEALNMARAGLEVAPSQPRLHACLANVLDELGETRRDPRQRQEAIAHYQEAVRLKPSYTDVYNSLGFMALQDHRDEAAGYFEQTLVYEPENARALYGLGRVDGLADRWAAAQQRFEQALRSDPRLVDAQNDLTVALVRQGKTSEAIEHLTAVVQRYPDRPEVHYELANLLVAREDLAGAAQHYAEAVRLRPGYIEALQNLGAALLKMGQNDRAIRCFGETLRLDPNNAQARANLAQAQEFKRMSMEK
ncbi:MAG TPA: tetratricopeptide repeat protein [Pirellulales bacterium]|jgi:tetratricopeptide (TPR) repeat protein